MQEAQLAEFPFVLKLSGSNGIVYYISAEGKKETFMASNDDINKPDKTQLPFTAAGRNGKKVSLKDDTLIQMTQNSLNNLSNNTKIAEKVEILLNNSLATSGIDNIGLFNNIAMGFGALTKNAETGKITFDHNEQFLFGDIDTAVKNVTPLENKEGAYSFTFEKAEINGLNGAYRIRIGNGDYLTYTDWKTIEALPENGDDSQIFILTSVCGFSSAYLISPYCAGKTLDPIDNTQKYNYLFVNDEGTNHPQLSGDDIMRVYGEVGRVEHRNYFERIWLLDFID